MFYLDGDKRSALTKPIMEKGTYGPYSVHILFIDNSFRKERDRKNCHFLIRTGHQDGELGCRDPDERRL